MLAMSRSPEQGRSENFGRHLTKINIKDILVEQLHVINNASRTTLSLLEILNEF